MSNSGGEFSSIKALLISHKNLSGAFKRDPQNQSDMSKKLKVALAEQSFHE